MTTQEQYSSDDGLTTVTVLSTGDVPRRKNAMTKPFPIKWRSLNGKGAITVERRGTGLTLTVIQASIRTALKPSNMRAHYRQLGLLG